MQLFQPIKVSNLELVNRLIFTPLSTRLSTRDGILSSEAVDFFFRRATGGVGLLFFEPAGVENYQEQSPHCLGLYDEKNISKLRDFNRRVHSETDTKTGIQLVHLCRKEGKCGVKRIEEFSPKEIREIVRIFGDAAKRAKEAEFDLIEIHAAHGLTLSSFLSLRNERDDNYGGNINNRFRIISEIIEEVRANLGKEYPIGVRINGNDFIAHGSTLTQTERYAKKLAELNVAYISVSAGGRYEDAEKMEDGSNWPYGGFSGTHCMPLAYMPNAVNADLAKKIKRAVVESSIPIVVAGKIPTPTVAESILKEGKADLIGLARPLLCDPDWPKKAKENKWREIKECMYCGFCNDYFNRLRQPVKCVSCTYPHNQCPAELDIPFFLTLLKKRRFEEALNYTVEKMAFPLLLGYVCYAPCEGFCRQKIWTGPIPIKGLHRFIAENSKGYLKAEESLSLSSTGKSIAVIGSGPAGLAAAYYLRKWGHSVDIFDEQSEPGGMLRLIPRFKLPDKVLNEEISRVESIGVRIKTGVKIESLDFLFDKGYQSIFVTTGAQEPKKLNVEVPRDNRIMDWHEFLLRAKNESEKLSVGKKVCIIGIGNTACDVAGVCLRLGAEEVVMKGLENLALQSKLEELMQMGVRVEAQMAPTKIVPHENTVSIEFSQIGKVSEVRTENPVPSISDSNPILYFDSVIIAIGQVPRVPKDFGLRTERRGSIRINTETMETSRKGVFAGGDVVLGEGSVVQAIQSGKRGAIAINKHLCGGIRQESHESMSIIVEPKTLEEIGESLRRAKKFGMPTLALLERKRTFSAVELGLTENMALQEAERCWKCDRFGST